MSALYVRPHATLLLISALGTAAGISLGSRGQDDPEKIWALALKVRVHDSYAACYIDKQHAISEYSCVQCCICYMHDAPIRPR